MIKVFRMMKPLTKIITLLISLLVVSSTIYAVVTFYSDTISMALGRYEDKFYRTTAIEIEPQEFTLEILDSDSRITVMTGGKATRDGIDVQVIPRYDLYIPSEVGEMIVWGVRYRTNGTIMYAETLLRKETSSDAEES